MCDLDMLKNMPVEDLYGFVGDMASEDILAAYLPEVIRLIILEKS